MSHLSLVTSAAHLAGKLLLEQLVIGLVDLGIVGPMEAGAEAEVGQLDVAILVDQDVVGLDVAVDEAQVVDTLDGAGELADVEAGERLAEDLELYEQVHEVAARHIVHDKVEALLVLERVVEFDDPFVVGLGQDVPLGLDVRRLVAVEDVTLVEDLHGVEALAVVPLADQVDLAEGAEAEHLHVLEHAFVHFGAAQTQIVCFFLA